MDKNRYFIVVYAFPGGFGSADFKTHNGGYLNQQETIKTLKELSPTVEGFVITNIIELSETDFNYFYHVN